MRWILDATEGWSTVVVNAVAAVASVLLLFGVQTTPEETGAVVAGIVAVVNIVLRIKTRTPIFTKAADTKRRLGFR